MVFGRSESYSAVARPGVLIAFTREDFMGFITGTVGLYGSAREKVSRLLWHVII